MNFLTGSNHVSSQANLLMNDIDGKVSNKQQSRGLMVMISRSQSCELRKDSEKVPGSIPGATTFCFSFAELQILHIFLFLSLSPSFSPFSPTLS